MLSWLRCDWDVFTIALSMYDTVLKATTLQWFTSRKDAAARWFWQETRDFYAEGDHTNWSVVGVPNRRTWLGFFRVFLRPKNTLLEPSHLLFRYITTLALQASLWIGSGLIRHTMAFAQRAYRVSRKHQSQYCQSMHLPNIANSYHLG